VIDLNTLNKENITIAAMGATTGIGPQEVDSPSKVLVEAMDNGKGVEACEVGVVEALDGNAAVCLDENQSLGEGTLYINHQIRALMV
jgi:hypothetical protein